MTKGLEEIKGKNTPLETNGVFEVEKEDTKKGIEDTLKIGKIIISEEEIEKLLKENRVIQRITLLRHYPYNEETEENRKIIKEYNELVDKKFKGKEVDNYRLSILSKIVDKLTYKTFEEIPDEKIKQVIRNTLINKDKTIFFYSKVGKERVRITGDDLAIKFGLNNIGEVKLTGSMPSDNLGDVFINMSSQLLNEYNRIKKEYQEYEEIIIVGNRTYSYGMNFISGDGDVTIRESEKDFEKDGYMFNEYNNDGKILRNTGNIIVTPENYEDFKKIFNIEHNGIVDFQNKLNVYFIKNPELIKRYVKSEIEELRRYCLIKLIETKELKTLDEIFREEKFRKEIKLEEYEKGDKRFYNILKYYIEVYPELLTLRKKSLDERINNGEDIDPDFNFDKSEYNEILELINTGKLIKYIEGKAGAGKSFLLSHIAEKLNEENLNNNGDFQFNINFLSLTGIKDFKEIKFKAGYENILLIDSIDESSIYGEKIKELDSILLELVEKGFKIIITSREGYLYDYSNDLEKNNEQYNLLDENRDLLKLLEFNIGNLNKYLDIYFGDDKTLKDTLLEINEKLNGIGNNPLILSMLCDLVKNGYKKENDENGYTSLMGLSFVSIINIYDKIIKLRLKNWNNSNENRKIDFDFIIKKLEKLAYNMLFEKKYITSFVLKQELGVHNDIHLKDNIEGINIFFKNSTIENNYEFIHQSFKEYFSAKYLYEEMKNKSDFDYEKFLCHDFKNIDINFIDIFYEFIKNDDKVKALLLKKLEDNQNYYSPFIHHKILYLLGKLSDFKLKLYLAHIIPNEKILEVLPKIGGEFYIDYIGKFINGKNPMLRRKAVEIFDGLGLERKGKEVVKSPTGLKNNKKTDFDSPNLFIIKEFEKIINDGLGDKGSYLYLKSQMTHTNVDVKIYIVDQILKFVGNTETDWFKKIGGKYEIDWLKEILKQHLETPYYKEQESYYKKLTFFIISKIIEFGGEKEIIWLKSQIGNYEIGVKNFIISKIIEFGGEKEIVWLKSQIGNYEMVVDEYIISNIIILGGNKEAEWIKKLILEGKNKRLYKILIYSLGYIGGKDNIHFIRSLLKYKSGLINKHVYGISKEIGGIGNIEFTRRIK